VGEKWAAVKTGASVVNQEVSRKYDTISSAAGKISSGAESAILFLGLFVFLADIFVGNAFDRSSGQMVIWLILYLFVAVIVYATYSKRVDQTDLLRECFMRSLISWGIPVVIVLVSTQVLPRIPSVYAAVLGNYLGVWAMILLVYTFGWPRLIMNSVAQGNGAFATIARWLNNLTFIAIMLFIILALFGALNAGGLMDRAGVNSVEYEQVSVGKIFTDAFGFFGNVATTSWGFATGKINDTSSLFNNQLDDATQASYTGTVERQQGQLLGVRIKDSQGLQPVYTFLEVDKEIKLDADKQAVWFGTVEARTFAENLEIDLRCEYMSSNGSTIDSVPARPQELTVYYTGEFADTYPFECAMPMDSLLKATNQMKDRSGRFMTVSEFDFQTWGYATMSFMDRDVITAMRQQGKNPATELGIDRYIQAKYTPGPVSLGMLENQQLPIGVTPGDPERTFIPAFGVTIRNVWVGRGDVQHLDQLVLQVPEPLILETDSCTGNVDSKGNTVTPVIRTDSFVGEVPQGYTWYEFNDLAFSKDQQLKTVRCPLRVNGDNYADLLGPDLSAKQFTLVALANYTYESQTPVPIRLGVERIS
jgi:hypothetical protein